MASGLSVIVTDPAPLDDTGILQVEGTVDIGRRGDRGTFDHDRRTDDRRTGLIEHTAGDAGGLRPQQRRREHGCHK